MHTKNINRRLQTGDRLADSANQPPFPEFSSDTYSSLRRTVNSHPKSPEMTTDLQRGSFQRKFRSLWFGTNSKKKENRERLQESSRVKSVSSPSLVATRPEKRTNLMSIPSSVLTTDSNQSQVCPEDCECNQVCPCCLEEQENGRESSPPSHPNRQSDLLQERDVCTSHTLPRNFTVCVPTSECESAPHHESVEDQYVFVVSDLDAPDPQLTVRTEQPVVPPTAPTVQSEVKGENRVKRSEDPDRSLASAIPDRMGSAESQDFLYKSSSESGRGTLPSETERLNVQSLAKKDSDAEYSAIGRKGSSSRLDDSKESQHHRSKYPQLYVASNRAPMPPVIESESWVSDTSTFQEVVRPSESRSLTAKSKIIEKSGPVARGTTPKSRPLRTVATSGSRSGNRPEKGYRMERWKSMETVSSSAVDRDDVTSEFTADVSVYNPREVSLSQDLKTLQVMYDKIFKRLSLGNHSGLRQHKRRTMGSISTINSISRAYENRRITSAHKHQLNDSSSKKIRRIEENVVSLTRSLGNLTLEVRETDKLREQILSLKKEFASIQKQMTSLQIRIDSQNSKGNSESVEKLYSSVKKQSRISRLFNDEPTPLRLFLKKLGYQRYSCLFEEERIGMEELMLMSEEMLHKLGIPLGPRTRIFQEIHKNRVITRTRHH